MELIITLRKQVESHEEGQQIFELVKQRLEDRPDITIRGHVTAPFTVADEPS
ncbi:hypothetical protein ES703_56348 [subsurface metagenome]